MGEAASRGTKGYRARVVDGHLSWLVDSFAAVSIDGARGVGKTATASRLARTIHRLDEPALLPIARSDPTSFLLGDEPILLDEWQHAPPVWDAVRRAVDDESRPGRFLLTGSASSETLHSGAGRILSLRMRPMALSERGIGQPRVSFADLLAGEAEIAGGGLSDVEQGDYATVIATSGFPDLLDASPDVASAWLAGYVQRVASADVPDLAQTDLRAPGTFLRWLTAYAAASATTATYESIRDAATPGEGDKPARATGQRYREALERLWLIEEQPGWLPVGTRLKRASVAPKHHVADPALALHLLRMSPDALRRDAVTFGRLFESLVTHTCRVFAEPLGASVSHLRTRAGEQEVDVIVEGRDGGVLGVEVKLGPDVSERDVRHLHWLRRRLGEQVTDLVVVNTGRAAHRRHDGIAVVPLAQLGP